jgi:hypothetical protein
MVGHGAPEVGRPGGEGQAEEGEHPERNDLPQEMGAAMASHAQLRFRWKDGTAATAQATTLASWAVQCSTPKATASTDWDTATESRDTRL